MTSLFDKGLFSSDAKYLLWNEKVNIISDHVFHTSVPIIFLQNRAGGGTGMSIHSQCFSSKFLNSQREIFHFLNFKDLINKYIISQFSIEYWPIYQLSKNNAWFLNSRGLKSIIPIYQFSRVEKPFIVSDLSKCKILISQL